MITVVSIIPCLFIGGTAYGLIYSSLLENSVSSNELMNTHKAEAFDLFVEEMELTLKDLTDSEATKAFLQLKDEPESESYYTSVLRLGEKLDTMITQRGETLETVAFLWNDGSLPMIRSNGRQLSLIGDYREQSPFTDMPQNDAAVHWVAVQNGARSGINLYLYKTMYDVLSGESLGIALICIRNDYIESILQTGSKVSDLTILQSETDGNLFSAGQLSLSMDEFTESLQAGKKNIGEMSFTIKMDDGIEYLCTTAQTEEKTFKIFNITPLSAVTNKSREVILAVVTAIFAVVILAGIMALALFRYLNIPLNNLYNAMTSFKAGNLEERIKVSRTDELGQLEDGFNDMADRINELIDEIQIEQKKKQEISMRFLQAQISPHFLYNTLNSIKVLTRMGRNEEAGEMVTSLISLLRLSSGGDEEITLSQEIHYTENYVLLMSKRKELQVSLESEIPEELRLCKVLKFTIQPFVENSIIHGNASEEGLQIRVIATKADEKTLCLKITDNGGGFDTDALKEKTEKDDKRFSHIGIGNVEERIKLYYGEGYGVTIDSKIGTGTEVDILVPLTQQ